MMKKAVIDGARRDMHLVVVPRRVGEHFRVQLTGEGAPWSQSANPYVPHARDAAGRPFLDHRLEPGRGGPDPEINREIVGPQITGGVSEADPAVGPIKIKRLSDDAVGE